MDKKLKRLSRVELLELMVDLSEDHERLSAENTRLKKMVSAQRLPRSTKVGSIAQAALEANGYFEAAQRSADDYLREIKHLRDELAMRADGARPPAADQSRQAQEQAQEVLKGAQEQARHIVERANAQAEAILAHARSRAEEALANANRQSHAIVAQARRQAGQAPDASWNTGSFSPVAQSAAATGPVLRHDAPYPHLENLPYVQGAPSLYRTAQDPDATVGFDPRDLRGAGSYPDQRSYASSAPAYAGGTATPTPAPDTTAEIFSRGNVSGAIPGRSV